MLPAQIFPVTSPETYCKVNNKFAPVKDDALSAFHHNLTVPVPCCESKQDYAFNAVLMNINTALYKIM